MVAGSSIAAILKLGSLNICRTWDRDEMGREWDWWIDLKAFCQGPTASSKALLPKGPWLHSQTAPPAGKQVLKHQSYQCSGSWPGRERVSDLHSSFVLLRLTCKMAGQSSW